MEMQNDLSNQNALDIAVIKEQLKAMEESMECDMNSLREDMKESKEMTNTIMTNHLPHISADIQLLAGKIDKKFVEYDIAKKIVFGAVGIILAAAVGALLK